jgi:hypothetical protein
MSLFVEQEPPRRIVISCDHPECIVHVDSNVIAANGGLLEMGWLRRFNSVARHNEYFCPEHNPNKEESSGN